MIQHTFDHFTHNWLLNSQQTTLEELRMLNSDPLYIHEPLPEEPPAGAAPHLNPRIAINVGKIESKKALKSFEGLFQLHMHPEHDTPVYLMRIDADTLTYKPSVFLEDLLSRCDWISDGEDVPKIHTKPFEWDGADWELSINRYGHTWIFAKYTSRVGKFIAYAEHFACLHHEETVEA